MHNPTDRIAHTTMYIFVGIGGWPAVLGGIHQQQYNTHYTLIHFQNNLPPPIQVRSGQSV